MNAFSLGVWMFRYPIVDTPDSSWCFFSPSQLCCSASIFCGLSLIANIWTCSFAIIARYHLLLGYVCCSPSRKWGSCKRSVSGTVLQPAVYFSCHLVVHSPHAWSAIIFCSLLCAAVNWGISCFHQLVTFMQRRRDTSSLLAHRLPAVFLMILSVPLSRMIDLPAPSTTARFWTPWGDLSSRLWQLPVNQKISLWSQSTKDFKSSNIVCHKLALFHSLVSPVWIVITSVNVCKFLYSKYLPYSATKMTPALCQVSSKKCHCDVPASSQCAFAAKWCCFWDTLTV